MLVPSVSETSPSESVNENDGCDTRPRESGRMIEHTTGTTFSSVTTPTSRHSPKIPCESDVVISGLHGTSASFYMSHVNVISCPAGWEPGPNG